jgi:hypothetical protein
MAHRQQSVDLARPYHLEYHKTMKTSNIFICKLFHDQIVLLNAFFCRLTALVGTLRAFDLALLCLCMHRGHASQVRVIFAGVAPHLSSVDH